STSLFYKLFYLCSFSYALSQVVQFRTSYFTASDHFNFFYIRGMQRPGFLYAYSVGSFTNGESLSVSAALFFQNYAFEYLDSFTVSLFDLSVYFYGVTYTELRCLCFYLLVFDFLDNVVHCFLSFYFGCS